jgi:ribosomal protein L34E
MKCFKCGSSADNSVLAYKNCIPENQIGRVIADRYYIEFKYTLEVSKNVDLKFDGYLCNKCLKEDLKQLIDILQEAEK